MGALVGLIIAHTFYPPSLEWVGESINLEHPSLAAVLGLVIVVWIFERVVSLQEEMRRPPFRIHQGRRRAYRALSEVIDRRGVRSLDLLQVSGQTASSLLHDIAESHPRTKVRLLLAHSSTAATFDADQNPDHCERIRTTVRDIEVLESEHRGFKVRRKYYTSPPGICAVLLDGDAVSLSWYPTFKDTRKPDVTRVRGHEAPTITIRGPVGHDLRNFAREHFDRLWSTAEDDFGA